VAILFLLCVLAYVGKNGFAVFGWWRIIVGSLALVTLSMGL
jgi:undecaprenyl-diphosphatase